MKKLLPLVFMCLTIPALAQNLATVSANNIADVAGNKLASAQLCFLATDQNDNPISFQVGGGGQVIRRTFCSTVTAGAAASFTVPNPATTSPSGIFYRVTVKDSSSGQEVLRYAGVTFSGTTFGFDSYVPLLAGAVFAPLTGTSVIGNLAVSGNLNVTGSFTTGALLPTSVTASGAVIAGQLNATTNATIPNLSGGTAYLGGGFASPIAGRISFGDGTGWKFCFARKNAGAYIDAACSIDTGDFQVRRLAATLGTLMTATKIALSAGWGSTATLTSVAGTDAAFRFIVNPNGTGIAASPTIIITFSDGTWGGNTPICQITTYIQSGPAPQWTFNGSTTPTTLGIATGGNAAFTPTAGVPIGVMISCVGSPN
jgi:hypothetical protein